MSRHRAPHGAPVPSGGHDHARRADPALHGTLHRLRRQLEAVGRLSQAEELLAGDVEGLARKVTELATHAIGCERANVWLFDADEAALRCIDCFEATPARHSAGMVLEEREYRNEFRALKSAKYVAADDALTDPRTAGYVASYVGPLGITSMLDTVIQISGKHLGLLCLEHVDRPHRWEEDEISFAGQLADKLGLALLSRMRLRAEAELRASESRFRATAAELNEAQHLARLGSWSWEPGTNRLTWSDELYRIVGRDRALPEPPLDAQLALFTPRSRAAVTAALRACADDGTPYALDLEFVGEDGRRGWILARGEAARGDDGVLRVRSTALDITERKQAENELRHLQAALAEAQAVAHVGSWQLDIASSRLTWSDESFRIFGDTPGASPASFDVFLQRVHPDDRIALAETFQRSLEERVPYDVEHRIVWDDGTVRVVQVRGETCFDADGAPVRTIGTVQDITRRKEAELALILERDFSTALIDSLPGLFVLLDEDARLVRWNENVSRLTGLGDEQLEGRDAASLIVDDDREHARETLRKGFVRGLGDAEFGLRTAGDVRTIQWSGRRITRDGKAYLVAVGSDVTERKRAEAQIRSLARHDVLTGLPNRAVFVEELDRAIARSRRAQTSFAVLYLDVDHFKDVNDTLGHPTGDLLLQAIARRLQAAVREEDTVARFGGDEFAIVEVDIREPSDAAALADKVLKTMGEPFAIGGNEIRTGTSIGIAVYGPDAPGAEQLLSHADVALYRAKSEGRGTYRFFTESMDAEVRARVSLGAELRHALASGQLFLEYQPQVDVHTGSIIGVEALVRWHHPRRGLVPPCDFIPAAERCGLIVTLGRWVLENACRQAQEWIDAGAGPPVISVNVSGLQFKTSDELEHAIAATLARTGLRPQLLELELTESVLMEASHDVLARLRKAGLRIAIDDFGNGYSSLGYLSRFPVDRIKIAQNFIFDLTTASRSAAIVKAAIGLAHELGLDVVVEGVESVEQLELIKAWGARKVQGFYFAPPLPADDVARLLRAGRVAARRLEGRAPPLLLPLH
ncbi:MAG: EAL domain-containing protein [Thermodesulfobacteriota bacterium]